MTTFRQFLSSRTATRIYVAGTGLLLLMLLADMFFLPWMVHWRGEIDVPNVVGMPLNEAWQTLEARGLQAVVTDTTASDKVKPGRIVFQNPTPRNIVREGRNVYLTVSGGVAQIAVPNLRGRSLRDAKITLEQLDLTVGLVSTMPSDLPAETVVAQSVPAGRRVSKAHRIDITVSGGPEMVQIDVPNVVGLSLDEAQKRLTESGLRVGAISSKASRTLVPNTVVGQSPQPGDKVDSGSPIDLIVSH
ncbi:MAG: PASTA domain-containing protein [Ignavibacteriae bacterium]|nr:PASTA domain-containing protein [Ignavibacteriota bacterium]